MRVVTALDRVRDEIRILRTLYHRNVVLLFEVIEADDNDKIYMVLEHMPLGPCMTFRPEQRDFVSPLTQGVLTDALARAHVLDILHGVEYLHTRGICHRDLKVRTSFSFVYVYRAEASHFS
ncbi:hypothetical protein PINS_up002450 [Pythium insidiosum]|nr:hypothetical protein PINS_up002450 [Pythium insidiosum]